MKRICVFTGTRAEYGLLYPLIKKIQKSKDFELQLIVSGIHLSSEFGLTYKQIEADGFKIDEKVEILLSSDTDEGVCKTMGVALISLTDSLRRLKPDLFIVLGDRYETFAASITAYTMKIPIAHIHGGETTEGAFDEAYRHSITKMSYLHFTSTEVYKHRVIQLGESPERVFNVGAIGLDNINELQLMSKEELEKELRFSLEEKKNIIVTFHPTTLEQKTSLENTKQLLKTLEQMNGINILFTKSNADSQGRRINELLAEFSEKNPQKSKLMDSLGQLRYLSCLKHFDCVIGNSSSGIIEAPYFKTPTLNIGDRQKGRVKPESVIDCNPYSLDIKRAIEKAFSQEFQSSINKLDLPYGDGHASDKIMDILRSELKRKLNLKKQFFDIKW